MLATTLLPIAAQVWAFFDFTIDPQRGGAISDTTGPDSSSPSQLTIDTTGMLTGSTHTALVSITHDDDRQPNPLALLVRVMVGLDNKVYLPLALKNWP